MAEGRPVHRLYSERAEDVGPHCPALFSHPSLPTIAMPAECDANIWPEKPPLQAAAATTTPYAAKTRPATLQPAKAAANGGVAMVAAETGTTAKGKFAATFRLFAAAVETAMTAVAVVAAAVGRVAAAAETAMTAVAVVAAAPA